MPQFVILEPWLATLRRPAEGGKPEATEIIFVWRLEMCSACIFNKLRTFLNEVVLPSESARFVTLECALKVSSARACRSQLAPFNSSRLPVITGNAVHFEQV